MFFGMQNPREKIGILGGSFNPVHMGHLLMAQDAAESFELSRVLFIPCGKPAHKDSFHLVSAEHRSRMIEYAIADNPLFSLSRIELDREGVSYTVDTLRLLTSQMPGCHFHFIIGSDTLYELHAWKDIDQLLQLCSFITIARPGFDLQNVTERSLRLPTHIVDAIKNGLCKGHPVHLSATDIRMRAAEGMQLHYLVPPEVEMYIREHNLYTT